MAEFPALPLFTDAYLADTRHLTAEEHGAYLLLLMCAWRTRGCALKDDNKQLARIVGVTPTRWRRLRPVLAEFFTIEDGLWRQKKLTEVYAGVEARVAKNRANGAKGGRVKAAKFRTATTPEKASECHGDGGGKNLPTKTRIQIPEQEAESISGMIVPEDWISQIAAATGLRENRVDLASLILWREAGACLHADILPTIRKLCTRQASKKGRLPQHLSYYTPAILEARDERLGAARAGQAHQADHPATEPKRAFDPTKAEDWRLFLGEAKSRFRGDYISRNWRIGAGHPVFLPSELGPDPWHSPNPFIPAEIYNTYGPAWHWQMQTD